VTAHLIAGPAIGRAVFIFDEWAAKLAFVVNEARSAAAGRSKTRGLVIAWTQLQNYPPTLVSSNPGFVRFLLHPRLGDLLRSWQKTTKSAPDWLALALLLHESAWSNVAEQPEQSRYRLEQWSGPWIHKRQLQSPSGHADHAVAAFQRPTGFAGFVVRVNKPA